MKIIYALFAAAFAALAIVPFAAPWLQFVLTIAIAKGFAAVGVALLLRAGLISIGHAMFYAAGAYTAAFIVLWSGISDLFVLLIASTLVTAAIGALVGAYLVRYRAIFFAMLNLAVSMVFFALLSKLYGITGGTDGLRVPVPTVLGTTLTKAGFDIVLFYVALALMAIIAGLGVQFLKSPLGHAVGAIHTNEVRLEYLGVSAWSVLLIAYTISAALAGLGGAIAAVSIGHVLPEYAYWTESGHLVLTAVLGGIGGVAGPFIGSIFLEIVHTVAVGVAHNAWNLIMGATLLLVIFFLPQGLYGLVTKSADKTSSAKLGENKS
ncbi:branched-chain amino acid ABC transporter permease [Pelagibacterium luteolum]|uniref:ABC-type branched-chain amino acid transport system, permease component n=1 Tax=Pelagibacterium luteolum TaxID=440168 RepID=A0A1G7XDE4_9HYPH|nr:branched-chain amino acid ABC transporter permease [Pelagibacterium luteolum]SDG82124.1 ABC-type branched-chain amino acid transport system, permease component [Pelagibacterium luteolum]